MSAPTANVYGLYYLPVLSIVNDTGRQKKQIEDALAILHDLCFAYYDPINQFVWVREMCREQLFPLPLRTGDWQINAANKWYSACPANLFLGPWFDQYAELVRLDGQRRVWTPPGQPGLFPSADSTLEGTSTLGASKPQLRTTSTGTPKKINRRNTTQLGMSFERFWEVWPSNRKIGKQDARAQWQELNPDDDLVDTIVQAVLRHRQTADWLKENGRYIIHPSRYLKRRRWEDVVAEGPNLSDATVQAGTAVAEFLKGAPNG